MTAASVQPDVFSCVQGMTSCHNWYDSTVLVNDSTQMLLLGALSKDHWEEWLPGTAMGAIHHTERRLPATNTVTEHRRHVITDGVSGGVMGHHKWFIVCGLGSYISGYVLVPV